MNTEDEEAQQGGEKKKAWGMQKGMMARSDGLEPSFHLQKMRRNQVMAAIAVEI